VIGRSPKRSIAEDLVDDVFSVVLAKSFKLSCDTAASKHCLIGCAPRFAFLDFLAMFNLPIGSIKTRHHTAAAYLNFADPSD
jgi:hypothetical protein